MSARTTEAIELSACHTRRAKARLEVECESGGGDKGSVTASAGTAHVGRLVGPGIQVLTKVVIALEKAIAVSAIMVLGALSVVLLTRVRASEVAAAIIARPVDTGSPYVLAQGNVAWEPYRAAVTIRHGMVVVRCEEEKGRCEEVEARSQNLYVNRMTHVRMAERPGQCESYKTKIVHSPYLDRCHGVMHLHFGSTNVGFLFMLHQLSPCSSKSGTAYVIQSNNARIGRIGRAR